MHRRKFLVGSSRAALGCLFVPLAARAQESQAPAEAAGALVAELERLLPPLMAEAGVPGLSIALVQKGRLHWRRGFGFKDSATKEPVDNDTVFEAASISKTVFAYVSMQLCQRGVLDLDRPLSKDAPEPFLRGDARLELITPRHVLSHTSGLQDYRSRQEPLRIHFTPGAKFLYSGEGYYYLQSVMTHLTGRVDPTDCSQYEAGLRVCATDIDPYIKRNLLIPFGMGSSGYVWNDLLERHSARPHGVDGKPSAKKQPTAKEAARYAAPGGLHTTPTDYAKFLIELIDPKESDAFRLSRKNLSEMLRPQIALGQGEKIDDADAWGLGWAIQQRQGGPVILHSGGQSGFRSLTMASVTTKSGFIALTNGDNGGKVLYHPSFRGVTDRLLAGSA